MIFGPDGQPVRRLLGFQSGYVADPSEHGAVSGFTVPQPREEQERGAGDHVWDEPRCGLRRKP